MGNPSLKRKSRSGSLTLPQPWFLKTLESGFIGNFMDHESLSQNRFPNSIFFLFEAISGFRSKVFLNHVSAGSN